MRQFLVLSFLLSSYCVAGQVKSTVISSDKTVANAMKMSSSEGKLLFLFFYADWVQLCQWMKTSTFTDPDLARFLNENALFLELNVETSIGNAEKQVFNVKALPTMILFDASGNQLVRIDEAMNAPKLLSKLKTWNLKENKQVQTGNLGNKSANQSLQHLTKAALPPSQPYSSENSEANYFGIAIKYFHQHDQALQYMQQFQGRVEKRVSVVSRELSTGLNQYQIIISKFSSMEEARAYLPKLRLLNISGEIIKF